VFRAVQSVIEADGFLAQPGADLLVTLRAELGLENSPGIEAELTAEELRESRLGSSASDYLCYMVLLAGLADGRLSDSESHLIDDFCAALAITPERRAEILAACRRAILEANVLMNLPEVISSSALARRYCAELELDGESLDAVAESILQALSEV
jgi:hypothetical protein